MNLDQLRESMSTLDEVLASKTDSPLRLNTSTCETAQKRIMKRYRNGTMASILIAAVFLLQWTAGNGEATFPPHLRLFLVIFLAVSALCYLFLYFRTKRINVFTSSPMQTMKQVASLRGYALTIEVMLAMAMAVFFTLFLSNLWSIRATSFWIIIAFLVVEIVLVIAVVLPHVIRDFQNLTSLT